MDYSSAGTTTTMPEVGPTPYASLLGPIDLVDRLVPRGVWRTQTTTTWCGVDSFFLRKYNTHAFPHFLSTPPGLHTYLHNQRNNMAIESSSNVGPTE